MEPLSDERLNEIKQRAEKATPGAWIIGPDTINVERGEYCPNEAKTNVYIQNEERDGNFKDCEIAFIAYARQDIPDLIAEIERLRANQQG